MQDSRQSDAQCDLRQIGAVMLPGHGALFAIGRRHSIEGIVATGVRG